MPHIVIVNAVYPPEPVVSAQMGRDLAVHLAQTGARVTVLCPPPSRPLGVDNAALRPVGRPLVRVEEGVEVVRLQSYTAPRSRLLPRMRESWGFGHHVCHYLEDHVADVGVVYANAWPLFSQALVARYCSQRGIPLILHIKDVYPESLLPRLPRFCRGTAASLLTALDRWTARRATLVVVISEQMRRTYVEGRGLASEKVVTMRDWVDESRFSHLPTREEACLRYAVPQEPFTFLYLGNIAPTAGVEHLIEAFHFARLSQAQLVIAGDGSAKAACVARASSLGSSEVRFISCPDAANVPLLQSMAHVCLLPLRKGTGFSCMPSKLMAYLFSAKPVLATVDDGSDAARCLQEAQCGWVGQPENAVWLAGKMGEVAALPAVDLDMMGQRGRAYGLRHFSKSEGVPRLANLVVAAGRQKNLPSKLDSRREEDRQEPNMSKDGFVQVLR
jgi:glycosyltransferase involved in cell wall biosynthesis